MKIRQCPSSGIQKFSMKEQVLLFLFISSRRRTILLCSVKSAKRTRSLALRVSSDSASSSTSIAALSPSSSSSSSIFSSSSVLLLPLVLLLEHDLHVFFASARVQHKHVNDPSSLQVVELNNRSSFRGFKRRTCDYLVHFYCHLLTVLLFTTILVIFPLCTCSYYRRSFHFISFP